MEAKGYIEKFYGDYEIHEGGYAMPTHPDGFYVNVEDLKQCLEQYIQRSLDNFIHLRDTVHRLEIMLP